MWLLRRGYTAMQYAHLIFDKEACEARINFIAGTDHAKTGQKNLLISGSVASFE